MAEKSKLEVINFPDKVEFRKVFNFIKPLVEDYCNLKDAKQLTDDIITLMKDYRIINMSEEMLDNMTEAEKEACTKYLNERKDSKRLRNYDLEDYRRYINLIDYKKFEGKYMKVTYAGTTNYYHVYALNTIDWYRETLEGLVGKLSIDCDYINTNDFSINENPDFKDNPDYIIPTFGYYHYTEIDNVGKVNCEITEVTKEEYYDVLQKCREITNKYYDFMMSCKDN